MTTLTIGIIGDFHSAHPLHAFTNSGVQHAAAVLGKRIETVWLPTDVPHAYERYAGLFCSPGSPYKNANGALAGIRYAREHSVPFLGTCGGFQHLVVEYARNVLGLSEANHAESAPDGSCLVVTPLACSLVGQMAEVIVVPRSKAARIFGTERTMEPFYCTFGINPTYRKQLEAAGLITTGVDCNGEPRIIELASHPFFFGTLFVPQARSRIDAPHPLVVEFCRAAADYVHGS